jgi:hypothetical protein
MLWAEPCRFERYAHLQQRAIRAPDHVRLHRGTRRWADEGASNLAMRLSRLWQIDSFGGLDLPQREETADYGLVGVR